MFNISRKNNNRHCKRNEATQEIVKASQDSLDCFATLAMTTAKVPVHKSFVHTLIKICGVKSPYIAETVAGLGADYIGLIFYPPSKRHVELPLAKTIAKAVRDGGATPVAVFVNQNAATMQGILDITEITTIQLHGTPAKAAHHQLDAQYTRIYVRAINTEGHFVEDTTNGLSHCSPQRDYILLDNVEAGQGKTLPWDALRLLKTENNARRGTPRGCLDFGSRDNPNLLFRFGLAGGLNPDNVTTAIQQVQPDLVDVSSGVETAPGEKSITLIANFIRQVRGYHHANP